MSRAVASQLNDGAPQIEAPGVSFDWNKATPELTITYRQNRFELRPSSFTIPVEFLDVLYAVRLNAELARRGIRVGVQPLPGGNPPNPSA